MTKEKMVDMAGVLMFYALIVIGVILINARFEYLNTINLNSNNYTYIGK